MMLMPAPARVLIYGLVEMQHENITGTRQDNERWGGGREQRYQMSSLRRILPVTLIKAFRRR
jgi:hypothetical protein